MSESQRLSAVFIGADTLLMECAQLWLDHGQDILAVISDAARIRSWAEQRHITVLPVADCRHAPACGACDYVFSVTHLALLPDELLAWPRRAAINFHDGPLPRYAGLNAPAWALLHGEREYGISWHEIRGGIDEGDVLKQRLFEIAPDETSISLNTRNFASAIDAYAELVAELSAGTAQKTPQDLTQRSYFGKFQRPAAAGVLDFERPAAELAALVRALDFGEYDSPLGTAKLLHRDRWLVVRAVEVVGAEAPLPPGTISALSDAAIEIATADQTLRILQLARPCGSPLPLTEAIEQLELAAGERLVGLSAAASDELARHTEALARAEGFWNRRLSNLEPATLALARVERATPAETVLLALPLPRQLSAADSHDAAALLATFALYLARCSGKSSFDLTFRDLRRPELRGPLAPFVNDVLPLRVVVDEDKTWPELVAALRAELGTLQTKALRWRDDLARSALLRPRRQSLASGELGQVALLLRHEHEPVALPHGAVCALVLSDRAAPELLCDAGALDADARALLLDHLQTLLATTSDPARTAQTATIAELPLLSAASAEQLQRWNDTALDLEVETETTLAALFDAQVARTPEHTALIFEDRRLSYRELARAAERVAGRLQSLGVGPEALVGVHVQRSAELVIAVLGVLKARAAYLPLDPSYPEERLRFMLADSGARVVLTDPEALARPLDPALSWLDVRDAAGDEHAPALQTPPAAGSQLAYVIYTSGSTGKPKGVMVEHRNVINFFAGMDRVIPHQSGDTWLSVTSLSFDISVLELFWSLTRGLTVVLHRDRDRDAPERPVRPVSEIRLRSPTAANTGKHDFSLFLWGAQRSDHSFDGYQLMLEAGRFGDRHGFAGIWTPERHFHAFGGAYPNPSVTGAALAAVTERIQIRAGSCVVPLHHAARVAEEWAVVDQLSRGRAGISFASGWQPDDFVLRPDHYQDNKRIMFEQIEQVRRLWRGESLTFQGPRGEVQVQTQPRPVQAELPFWITTAGNPETFKLAGRSGANLLTHLLGQSLEEVAEKIASYRRARAEAGHDPRTGIVSLMLHTHVGTSAEEVRERVREPMKAYLRSSVQLIKGFAWAFPAFKRPAGSAPDANDIDIAGLSEAELDAVLEFAFERYFETSGLFGTPESCRAMVERVRAIGVDDIACLIDFGMSSELVLEGLPYLTELMRAEASAAQPLAAEADDYSLPALVAQHGVTHLQATPALLRMARESDAGRRAVDRVRHLLVGGEAFPDNLARELRAHDGTVTNMYGPTETTVWSATHRLQAGETSVPIGRPIANTRLYVLDSRQRQLPIGIPGELYIAGHGVVRGYLGRPELTEQRFSADPFVPGERMYKTGDLVRWTAAGEVEFLGRTDHQVKVRGYRIELGEIEALLLREPSTREAVVVAREDTPGDVRLVAYVTGDVDVEQLRELARTQLPSYMVPSAIVQLSALPQTPNGKIARNALPAPETLAKPREYAAPESALEGQVAQLWCGVLGKARVGIDDNFFDIGGHSLLIVKLHRALKAELSIEVALTDLYRFPTVRAFVARWTGGATQTHEQAQERASLRRERLGSLRGLANRRRAQAGASDKR